jgi:hypothetical protein
MDLAVVVVRPSAGVWLVECADETRVFTRASEAELWARQAARFATQDGSSVELRVMDLKGELAGAVAFGPAFATV